MTGILIPNARRRVSVVLAGKTLTSLESVAALQNGTLLRVTEGRAEGSRLDGSEYVAAHVQVRPGTVIRVIGYGPEQVAELRALKEGDAVNAYLIPMGSLNLPMARITGYKLAELVQTEAPTAEAGAAE